MPERRTSSVTSFMSSLHFSGKVIMASVLFGFGLLLVGAILLIIATGGQKSPPLQENSEEKKTPMIYVGPGVMGVGAFFVIVGTIMCLFETRILRRRKNTEHDSLVHSEILPTGNARPPFTENQEDMKNVEETQVKTVQVQCHTEDPAKSLEKTSLDVSSEKKDYDRQFSSSTDKEQTQSLTASVYLEAVGENDTDENDNEEHFTSGSLQFSTPPQGEVDVVSKDSLGCQPATGHDPTKIPDPVLGARVTTEAEKRNDSSLSVPKDNEIPLPVPKDSEIPLPVTKDNEIPLPVPKDNKIPLSVSNDSILTAATTHSNLSSHDLANSIAPTAHTSESTEDPIRSNDTANEEPQKEGSQVQPPIGLLETNEKDLLVPDSKETIAPPAENAELPTA